MSKSIIKLTGKRFGRLTVLNKRKVKKETVFWLCKCICGNKKWISLNHLPNGHTKSCGCLQREKAKEAKTTHGRTKTKEYVCWAHIFQRCNNPKVFGYKYYGGRGIIVIMITICFLKLVTLIILCLF